MVLVGTGEHGWQREARLRAPIHGPGVSGQQPYRIARPGDLQAPCADLVRIAFGLGNDQQFAFAPLQPRTGLPPDLPRSQACAQALVERFPHAAQQLLTRHLDHYALQKVTSSGMGASRVSPPG